MTCPVPDAHRSLDDVHAEWHDALDAYFDPHKFRRTYNSFLSAVQSTVDRISRQKRVIARGERRLQAWKDEVALDKVQKWADLTRNMVIHERDLSMNSAAWIEYSDVRRDLAWRMNVDPETESEALLAGFLLGKPESLRSGVLRVSRKWLVNTLPDIELLEAGTILYRNITRLVSSFHMGAGGNCSDLSLPVRECSQEGNYFVIPACMIFVGEAVTKTIDVGTRLELVGEVRPLVLGEDLGSTPEESVERLRERYGSYFNLDGDPIQVTPLQMRAASMFLTVDSEALPYMMLYKNGTRIEAFPVSSAVQGSSKIALFRMLADRVRLTEADGVIFTSETWTTYRAEPNRKIHKHEETFYDIRPDRGEALVVISATKDGRQLMMVRDFSRDDAGWPVLGRISTHDRLPWEWRPMLAALRGIPVGGGAFWSR